MPERPELPRPDDPLAALRRSVAAHQAVTQASVEAGKQLREPAPEPAATEQATA